MRYIHFLACFLGLAYLPFGKFFHLIATPFNLTVHAGEEPTLSDPANIATRRAMSLDACTHCGLCSLHCSVAPVFRLNPNANILPSEKLISIKAVASGQNLGSTTLEAISEDGFFCTNCYRCTTICPSGINLQDLWNASKEDLITKGFPQPHIRVRELTAAKWADRISDHERVCFADEKPTHRYLNLADRAETFAHCSQCTTCTDVCPVVAATDNFAQVDEKKTRRRDTIRGKVFMHGVHLLPDSVRYGPGSGATSRERNRRVAVDTVSPTVGTKPRA